MKDGRGPHPSKAHLVDYPPKEAYFVHLTTGVNMNMAPEDRGNYAAKDKIFASLDSLMP